MSGKISCSTCGEFFIGEPPDWLWIIVGKKKLGEIMSNCDRCGKESRTSTGSYFNTDQICLGCWKKEKAHPDYERARIVGNMPSSSDGLKAPRLTHSPAACR